MYTKNTLDESKTKSVFKDIVFLVGSPKPSQLVNSTQTKTNIQTNKQNNNKQKTHTQTNKQTNGKSG